MNKPPEDISVETRARELLAAEYEAVGNNCAAFTLRQVGPAGIVLECAVSAIKKALALSQVSEAAITLHDTIRLWSEHGGPELSPDVEAAMGAFTAIAALSPSPAVAETLPAEVLELLRKTSRCPIIGTEGLRSEARRLVEKYGDAIERGEYRGEG